MQIIELNGHKWSIFYHSRLMQTIFWSLQEGRRNGIIQLHLLRSYWSHFLGLSDLPKIFYHSIVVLWWKRSMLCLCCCLNHRSLTSGKSSAKKLIVYCCVCMFWLSTLSYSNHDNDNEKSANFICLCFFKARAYTRSYQRLPWFSYDFPNLSC
jgi:hypothetical protein